MKNKTNMKMLRFFLVFILVATMPLALMAEVVKKELKLKVGDYQALCTPKSPFDGYPSLSALTRWWWDGPIQITSDRRPAAVVIKATGTGTATVICDAYFWDSNWLNSTKGYRDLTIRWDITIEEGTSTPPTTGPAEYFDFLAGDVITRSVDGVDMKFEVSSSNDYAASDNFGPAYVYGLRISGTTEETAIPVSTVGHISIPEIVPNTSGCIIKWIYNPSGSYDLSPKLNALRVEQVMQSAFYGCDKLTSVEIPATVTNIGYEAFYGCTSLEAVTVLSPTPPSIGNKAFSDGVRQKAILWVPKGAKDAYSNSGWNKYFENIQDIGSAEPYLSLKDGDTFTATTEEGVEMTFKVISAAERTCQVGVGSYVGWDGGNPEPAIDHDVVGQITIPSVAKGFAVIGIGGTAFWCCDGITKVVVPNSVKYIEEQAFVGCSKLSAVTLPVVMNYIGDEAFMGCETLSDIEIPEGVKRLSATFYGCTNLSKVQLPSTLAELAGGGSEWLVIHGVFQNCEKLSTVILPPSLTSIGTNSFSGCKNLMSINIPDGVTSIGSGAFYDCTSLENVILPPTLTHIAGYKGLISSGAFEGSGIKSINIPASVTEIGMKAFASCPNLGSIAVDKQNTVYDSRENCNAIILTDGDSLIVGCKNTFIPSTVKKLAVWSFFGVSGLRQIVIPKNVVSVRGNAFSNLTTEEEFLIPAIANCSNLERIIVEEGNPVYDSREDCNAIIETATKKLVIGTSNSTMPNSVTVLGCLSICNGRSSDFTIPKHIKNLEPGVFGDGFFVQSPVTGVAFEEGTMEIPVRALYENGTLTKLTLPSTITAIGDSAFVGCYGLTTIISHIKNPRPLGYTVFDRRTLFNEDVTLYVPKGSKELYEHQDVWSYFQNIVEMVAGDVNGDGKVDVADIASIIDVMAGNTSSSLAAAADVNSDGATDVADISMVISIMAGDVDDDYHISAVEWKKTSKVEYRYLASSTPPDYHRSFTISISEDVKEITIDSYGNILLSRQYTNTPESFQDFKEALSKTGIYMHERIFDNPGCTGGTTDYFRLYNSDVCFFSGFVYHCLGENGDLYFPRGAYNLIIEQIPEKVEDLINSTR